jgi:predicted transcriptional regulator
MTLITEGLAPNEIANLLGRTPEAVRQSLLMARRRLREKPASDQQSGTAAGRQEEKRDDQMLQLLEGPDRLASMTPLTPR